MGFHTMGQMIGNRAFPKGTFHRAKGQLCIMQEVDISYRNCVIIEYKRHSKGGSKSEKSGNSDEIVPESFCEKDSPVDYHTQYCRISVCPLFLDSNVVLKQH